MTSKQRAALRSMANTMEPIVFVGKEGINKNLLQQVWDALEKRELIKCTVQQNCPLDAQEACNIICDNVHAQPIQCIGKKFVIYRQSRKPIIDLNKI